LGNRIVSFLFHPELLKKKNKKKRMKKYIILLIIITIIPFSSAYTYLNIYIDETGEALFLGETNEELILPEQINLKDGIISGKTDSLTNKQGEIWEFSYELQGAEINLIMPEGTTIKEISQGEISSNGHIEIYFQESIQLKYTIEPITNKDYFFYILTILIVFAILIYFFKLKIKPAKAEPKSLDLVKKTLHKRQQKIIEQLEKIKAIKGIKHTQLRKIVNIPKASFTRHIQELEKKGLIERIGEGKNKLIKLK